MSSNIERVMLKNLIVQNDTNKPIFCQVFVSVHIILRFKLNTTIFPYLNYKSVNLQSICTYIETIPDCEHHIVTITLNSYDLIIKNRN